MDHSDTSLTRITDTKISTQQRYAHLLEAIGTSVGEWHSARTKTRATENELKR